MGFFAWLALVVVGYASVWAWTLMVVTAARLRKWAYAGVAVAGPVAAVALLWGRVLPGGTALGLAWATGVAGAGVIYLALVRRDKDWQRRKARREEAQQIALHLVLITGCLLFALPYAWMVITSFKPEDEIFSKPGALPSEWLWSNYPKTFQFLEMALPVGTLYGLRFMGNTLYVTALSMAGMLLSSSIVAYSFARLRWPGRDLLFVVVLATMMLPGAVTMIPQFLIYNSLGWVDTLYPLWVPSFFAGAFQIFLLRQFFMTIPTDLEDAAKIDGAGYFTIYWRVMLPLIKPALASLAIMHFMATWNEFMTPLIYLSSPELMTGSYALQLFKSASSGEWALQMAAATLWTLPVLLLFFFAQRYFIQGITLTGLGGR